MLLFFTFIFIAMLFEKTSLATLATQLRDGSLSANTIMEACEVNYQRTESKLNAYKTWAGATAFDVANSVDLLLKSGYDLGPLMGVPVSVKDLFVVPGMPTFAGSSSELDVGSVAGKLVQTFIQQLAPITGKSHTVEFAFGGVGTNAHWGTPRNPWDKNQHRIPGGSSSGAGVSLRQGSALLALGTDTAGSVRIPASFTGTTALKTTSGLWPTEHTVPLSTTLDTMGLLARSVEDLAYGYCAIESQLRADKVELPTVFDLQGLRIGVPEHFFWDDGEESVINAVEYAMTALEKAGAILVPIKIPNCNDVYTMFQAGGLGAPELSDFLHRTMPTKLNELDSAVKMRIDGADTLTSVDYLHRVALLKKAACEIKPLFNTIDVWLNPTVVITPPTLEAIKEAEAYKKANMLVLRNASIANLLGLCAVSLPVGQDKAGMPVGMQITGAAFQEAKLLAIATQVERVLGKPYEVLGQMPAW